ncbi:unnamed protein product [Brassica rapa]|uniref:BnaA08g26810D protein n=2 Tax=Brassica TaxID=3705 RepID=A0A078H053_BRANA|nr:unnamed protein product [Brassica rapa]CDY31131.1 BnaA08g26810D [Brassica napus]VDD08155.1 unnamed protein product [Brassica rapa]
MHCAGLSFLPAVLTCWYRGWRNEPNASSRRSWFPESPVFEIPKELDPVDRSSWNVGKPDGSPEAFFEPARAYFITLGNI